MTKKTEDKYLIVRGKSPEDVLRIMGKYTVSMLGALSEHRTYWYQTFIGSAKEGYVEEPKPRNNMPTPKAKGAAKKTTKAKNTAGVASGVKEGFIPEDMK